MNIIKIIDFPQLNNILNNFNGENCYVFDESHKLLSEGTITKGNTKGFKDLMNKSLNFEQDENESITVSVKNLTYPLESGVYIVKTTLNYENSFYLLEISSYWESYGTLVTKNLDAKVVLFMEVNEQEYETFKKRIVFNFDWPNIIVQPSGVGQTKSDSFEDLCIEMISKWQVLNLDRIGKGVDRARDGSFIVNMDSWIPIVNKPTKWVLQCKYSEQNSKLEIDEIYSEMVKVLMHQPDYYLLMTNRKITSDFIDWFNSETINSSPYFIPFKKILIQKEQIEAELSKPEFLEIRMKYFR
ncbi:TPA: hypothetical protein R2I11_004201 [Bacillus cereus]|nr:hypothetical protein [Bacillus cereus]